MNEDLRRRLNQWMEVLRTENIPLKEVYLFGSHAYGTPDDESDVDLCIVSDLKGQRRIDVMIKARKALGTVTKEPIDIIVYEQDDFHKRAEFVANMEHTIKTEGVRIYGQ